MTTRLRRLPPAGEPLLPAALASLRLGSPGPAELRESLGQSLDARRVDLTVSGREALRRALEEFARRSGREEAVVPAYTCFSVASAVVAAGLRVRLVDVTPEGWIDRGALEALPLERAAAIVVCNLFGIAEPIAAVRSLARQAGVAVIDDAAQALGARDEEGPAGGRGDAGVLSFGRGKPLACLGGGALVWRTEPPDASGASRTETGAAPWRALLEACAHDVVLSPWVFSWVARIPWLHVGESRFEADFAHGGIPGSALALALGALPRQDALLAARRARAAQLVEAVRTRTRFRPLAPKPGDQGAFPRLALVAPSAEARDRALTDLAGSGAAALYPTALDEIERLRSHLAASGEFPGAHAFAARLLTIPSHPGLSPARRDRVIETLARI